MLELRPNFELCDRDLPAQSPDAMICTYECTYCQDCVKNILHNVCPTCGGGFVPRPIRPQKAWRSTLTLGLVNNSASQKRVHSKYSRTDIDAHVQRIRHLAPEDR